MSTESSKPFTRYYFKIFHIHEFHYFKSEKDSKSTKNTKGFIDLRKITEVVIEEGESKITSHQKPRLTFISRKLKSETNNFHFKVITADLTYYFAASGNAEMQNCVNALQQFISQNCNNNNNNNNIVTLTSTKPQLIQLKKSGKKLALTVFIYYDMNSTHFRIIIIIIICFNILYLICEMYKL